METLVLWSLLGLYAQLGASAETQRALPTAPGGGGAGRFITAKLVPDIGEPVRRFDQRLKRETIRCFIEGVNPRFKEPDMAANQLIYCEQVTGAPAELMAALVAQERRWSLRPNPPYTAENLCQVLHSTGRRCFGRSKAKTWEENLLWGARYLRRCMRARVRAKYGRDAELRVAHWNERDLVFAALREYNGGPRFARKSITKRYARAVLYYRGRMRAREAKEPEK